MKCYSDILEKLVRVKLDLLFSCLFIMSILSVTTSAHIVCAQDPKPSEYQVKAAFILNFAKFVEWPTNAFVNSTHTMNLCIVGEDPFGADLDAIRDETIGNKKITIKYRTATQSLKECQIVFVSRSEKKQLSQIVNALKGASILSIGDTEGFAQQKVIINFYLEENRVRFEINEDAARSVGLKISSKLLKLAKIVHSVDIDGY